MKSTDVLIFGTFLLSAALVLGLSRRRHVRRLELARSRNRFIAAQLITLGYLSEGEEGLYKIERLLGEIDAEWHLKNPPDPAPTPPLETVAAYLGNVNPRPVGV